MTERTGCEARQHSDQMLCDHCGLAWDMNDPDPPECQRQMGVRESRYPVKNMMATGVPVYSATVERKVETAKLPVATLDGPVLEMAFYNALQKAGIKGFVPREAKSYRPLNIEIFWSAADDAFEARRFGAITAHGSTGFIAAARCFVKSVYGPDITIRMEG